MADVDFVEQSPEFDDAALRDRRANSKALKTLGVDSSARKQRQMLGLDSGEYDRARKEASESTGEPLAGGHSISIPPEQIRAQLRARRRRRSSSSPDPRKQRNRLQREPQASSSNGVGEHDEEEIVSQDDSDSIPPSDYDSLEQPQSDDAARRGLPINRSQEFSEEEEEDEFADTLGSSRRRWRTPQSTGLVDDDGDTPLSTSAPNRYFYYYFDGKRQQPRRRRASFDSEFTPMIDKRANRKALSILGINPSEEKVMDILGIEQPEDLQSAVNSALTPDPPQDLPPGRPLQAKALSTLGITPPPTKADVLLGRFESHTEGALEEEIYDFQIQASMI